MTTLTPTEQLVFALEKEHAAERQELECELEASNERLKTSSELIDSLNTLTETMQQRIALQEETLIIQEAIMAQQDKQIQRIKPTLFGAFMGGMGSGAILATVITAYILWVQG